MLPLERRSRILIIDDNSADILLVKVALEEIGFAAEISTCKDGESALACINSCQDPPGAVVLDLNLPGLDGLEVLRALRRSPVWNSVPVLFLTGSAMAEHEAEITRWGAEFLKKPCTYSAYLDAAMCIRTLVTDSRALSRPVSACAPSLV